MEAGHYTGLVWASIARPAWPYAEKTCVGLVKGYDTVIKSNGYATRLMAIIASAASAAVGRRQSTFGIAGRMSNRYAANSPRQPGEGGEQEDRQRPWTHCAASATCDWGGGRGGSTRHGGGGRRQGLAGNEGIAGGNGIDFIAVHGGGCHELTGGGESPGDRKRPAGASSQIGQGTGEQLMAVVLADIWVIRGQIQRIRYR